MMPIVIDFLSCYIDLVIHSYLVSSIQIAIKTIEIAARDFYTQFVARLYHKTCRSQVYRVLVDLFWLDQCWMCIRVSIARPYDPFLDQMAVAIRKDVH